MPSTATSENAELVLLNTVSRLGCTVSEARAILAKQAGQQPLTQAEQPAPQQSSKGESSDEALL